jgi:hypothetical protein
VTNQSINRKIGAAGHVGFKSKYPAFAEVAEKNGVFFI